MIHHKNIVAKIKKIKIRYLFNGRYFMDFTIKKAGVLLFLLLWGFIYTGNRYYAERKLRIYNRKLSEIKRYEAEQKWTEIKLGNKIRPSKLREELMARQLPLNFSCDTVYTICLSNRK